MQLEYRPAVKRLPNGSRVQTFDVLCDGQVVDSFGTRTCAVAHMDRLWQQRPEADRELERQYLYSIGEL